MYPIFFSIILSESRLPLISSLINPGLLFPLPFLTLLFSSILKFFPRSSVSHSWPSGWLALSLPPAREEPS